jgi:hypothetical protein
MMLGVPGGIEAGGFCGGRPPDGVANDLPGGLVIAALLRQR